MEWFIKIPNAILQDKDLNHTQMILYGYIKSLSMKKWYCYASNKTLGDYLNIQVRAVQRHLNKLKEKWYIKIEIEDTYVRKIIGYVKNDRGVCQNWQGGMSEMTPYIDNRIDNKIKEIEKEFETFRKLFPHARKWKKQDAKKFYLQINDPTTVIKEVKHLKLKIQAWIQDWQFIPACERWIRDFTPISDEVKVKDLERIMRRHLTTEWTKERYPDLVEVYGEERVKAMAKKLSPTLDFNKPKDVQI